MIKLIATDMDGTLLDSKKQLPAELPVILKELREKEITFAVASGRSLVTLKGLFGEMMDDIIFICDNGACIQMPGEKPVYHCLPFEIVHRVLDICKEHPDVVPVLCSVKNIYYPIQAKEQFRQEINNFYYQFEMLDYAHLYHVTDPVMKIALCDMRNPAKHIYPVLKSLIGEEYELAVSGALWMDIMCKGVHKGAAIRELQEKMGISREETMAFGDYGNDVTMMHEAYYSCAMENAAEEVKKAARFLVPSNDENGVVRTICRYTGIDCQQSVDKTEFF